MILGMPWEGKDYFNCWRSRDLYGHRKDCGCHQFLLVLIVHATSLIKKENRFLHPLDSVISLCFSDGQNSQYHMNFQSLGFLLF